MAQAILDGRPNASIFVRLYAVDLSGAALLSGFFAFATVIYITEGSCDMEYTIVHPRIATRLPGEAVLPTGDDFPSIKEALSRQS